MNATLLQYHCRSNEHDQWLVRLTIADTKRTFNMTQSHATFDQISVCLRHGNQIRLLPELINCIMSDLAQATRLSDTCILGILFAFVSLNNVLLDIPST